MTVPTSKGPTNEFILPDKLNKPKPFPKLFIFKSFVIRTLLALCIDPIKKEMNITLLKNWIFVCAIKEPYIKSKSKELSSNSGLGLGTFLGKTLLERQNAKLLFKRNSDLGGALVIISWSAKSLTNS